MYELYNINEIKAKIENKEPINRDEYSYLCEQVECGLLNERWIL